MAVLLEADLVAVWAEAQRLASEMNIELAVVKSVLRDAVNATDQWIDDNAASYNSALPVAARNNLTTKQKARLFMMVARRRYEVA